MMQDDLLHKTRNFGNSLGECYPVMITKPHDLPSLTNVRGEAPNSATDSPFCALKKCGPEVNSLRSRHRKSGNFAPGYRLGGFYGAEFQGGFGTGTDMQLAVNILEMPADRAIAPTQPVGNFLVRQPRGQQFENLVFARSESVHFRRRRAAAGKRR